MSPFPTRRGLLRDLLAALFGWAGLRNASPAAPPAPPRCPHYYDGRLWCERHPGRTGHYVGDAEHCPFCHGAALARQLPRDPAADSLPAATYASALESHTEATTFSYCQGSDPRDERTA